MPKVIGQLHSHIERLYNMEGEQRRRIVQKADITVLLSSRLKPKVLGTQSTQQNIV